MASWLDSLIIDIPSTYCPPFIHINKINKLRRQALPPCRSSSESSVLGDFSKNLNMEPEYQLMSTPKQTDFHDRHHGHKREQTADQLGIYCKIFLG